MRPPRNDVDGLLQATYHTEGYDGDVEYDSSMTLGALAKTISGVTVKRPTARNRTVYPAGPSTQTGGHSTAMLDPGDIPTTQLHLDAATASQPSVASGNNGSGSAVSSSTAYRADGTVSFTKSPVGTISYAEYTNGQLTKSIQDADTSLTGSGQELDGVTIPGGFSSSGTELRYITTYTYDAQGRMDSSTLPDGRVTKMYYTKLADGRMVTLSIPRFVAGSPDTFYGPVACTVSNLAGKPEAQITVALSSSTTALSGWIDDTDADPITAVDVGTVARLALRHGHGRRRGRQRPLVLVRPRRPLADRGHVPGHGGQLDRHQPQGAVRLPRGRVERDRGKLVY